MFEAKNSEFALSSQQNTPKQDPPSFHPITDHHVALGVARVQQADKVRTIARGLIRAQKADKENYQPIEDADPEGATSNHQNRSCKGRG